MRVDGARGGNRMYGGVSRLGRRGLDICEGGESSSERVGGGLFGSVGADRPFPFQKDHPRGAGRP